MKTFRAYVQDQSVILEGEGTSHARMALPVTQAMANLISLIPGSGNRTRALAWLIGPGLYQASTNRQKLFEELKQRMSAGRQVIPSGRARNVPPPGKLGGVQEMAQSAYEYWGHDPNQLSPLDIFSPDSLERFPQLQEMNFGGMSLDEYWLQKYEPKHMTIWVGGQESRATFPLQKMNAYLENELHVEPFYYGGYKGYLQYVEKGDWLPLADQRHGSPNKQFGPDLRPNPLAKPFDIKDKGTAVPIYRFVGGSIRPQEDLKSLEKVVSGLEYKMTAMADHWKSNPPTSDDAVALKNFIDQSLQRKEVADHYETSIDPVPKSSDDPGVNLRDPVLAKLWKRGYDWREIPDWDGPDVNSPTPESPAVKKYYLVQHDEKNNLTDKLLVKRITYADGNREWTAVVPADISDEELDPDVQLSIQGKKGLAKRLYGATFERINRLMMPNHPDYPSTPEEIAAKFDPNKMVSPEFDLNNFLKLVHLGMHEPSNPSEKRMFKNPENFSNSVTNPEKAPWNGEGNPPDDGFWQLISDTHIRFSPNDTQKKAILDKITSELHKGYLVVRGRWSEVAPETNPGSNAVWVASGFINNATSNDPELRKNVKHTLYNPSQSSPDWSHELDQTEREVNPVPQSEKHAQVGINLDDPYLRKLWDAGYRWKGGTPNWDVPDKAKPQPNKPASKTFALVLGDDIIEIKRLTDINGERKWLAIDVDADPTLGKKTALPRGSSGSSWLAGNVLISPNTKTQELTIHPASRQDYEKFVQDLMQGKYGEPKGRKVLEESDLPCIKQAVMEARNFFDDKEKIHNASEIAFPNDDDLIQWGIEGLWSRAGDPVMKWGYLTKRDYAELETSAEEQLEKLQNAVDPKKVSLLGLHATLARIPPNQMGQKPDPERVASRLIQALESGKDWDEIEEMAAGWGPSTILHAISKNAFSARKRIIKGYVYTMMMRNSTVNSKEKTIQRSGSDNDEEQGTDDYVVKGRQFKRSEDDEERDTGYSHLQSKGSYIDIDAVRRLSRGNVQEPEQPIQDEPKATQTRKVSSPSDPMDDLILKPQKTIRQPSRLGSRQPKQYNPWDEISPEDIQPAQPVPRQRQPRPVQPVEYNPWDDISQQDLNDSFDYRFLNYTKWREMAGSSAVYDGTKPKDGCGFNWWGAVGDPLGVSIEGEVNTKKKGSHGRRKRSKK